MTFYDVFILETLDPILFKSLNKVASSVNLIEDYTIISTPYQLIPCQTMSDEISYVANQISSLIDEGISPNQIKIHAAASYLSLIQIIFEQFNLVINNTYNYQLYQLDITKDTLVLLSHYNENLDTLLDINDFLLEKYLDHSNESHDVYQKLMTVLNGYLQQELLFKDILEDIIYTFKNTNIHYPTYKEGIQTGDVLNHQITLDTHLFVLGLNASEIPKIYTDNDFLSDVEKTLLGIFTSYDQTRILKLQIVKQLNTINHLYLTYKSTTTQGLLYHLMTSKDKESLI